MLLKHIGERIAKSLIISFRKHRKFASYNYRWVIGRRLQPYSTSCVTKHFRDRWPRTELDMVAPQKHRKLHTGSLSMLVVWKILRWWQLMGWWKCDVIGLVIFAEYTDMVRDPGICRNHFVSGNLSLEKSTTNSEMLNSEKRIIWTKLWQIFGTLIWNKNMIWK